uniref:GmrSD restriction endonuclease domain-containing protein n=1 Tax=Pseudomonas aeruginosa TaxID=287 RepID=UPI0020CDDADC
RHHLPHHPLPMLYRITRHTALTSAHRPRLIESTHTTTILTRREGMKLKMKHPLQNLVTLRGAKTGFHIEHILSRNAESLDAFDGDEERFEVERNRLGGVLLMKGKDNISSGNELYADKLKSYANTLYWNETLRSDSYHSKLDFRDFTKQSGLGFRALDEFGPSELEERQKLLFEVAALIWNAS